MESDGTKISIYTFTRGGDVIDVAEADTPEAAVAAARTLLEDHYDSALDVRATASFYGSDGKLVRALVTRTDLREGATA